MKNLLTVFFLITGIGACGDIDRYNLKSKSNGLYSCSAKVFWDQNDETYSVMECIPLEETPVTAGTFYIEYVE